MWKLASKIESARERVTTAPANVDSCFLMLAHNRNIYFQSAVEIAYFATRHRSLQYDADRKFISPEKQVQNNYAESTTYQNISLFI